MEATTPVEPRPCTPQDVGIQYTDETTQWVKDACEKYFSQFDAPRYGENDGGILMSKVRCSCGRPLGGFIGSFTWGLAFGEGSCSNCKRPGRAYHRLCDEQGGVFADFGPVILLYRVELLEQEPQLAPAGQGPSDA